MIMFQRIVVPLDGSRCAEYAIPVAARLARASGGSVVFVRVVLPPVDFGKYAKRRATFWERKIYETQQAESARYLAGVMITHGGDLAGIDVEMGVATGIVPSTICMVAHSERAEMTIMSSHGESGLSRWFFGSVAREVSRQSTVPVLVLHERGGISYTSRTTRPLRVVLALDGSAHSETAILPAAHLLAALAAQGQGELHLLRVVDLPATEGRWRYQAHIDTLMREQARQEAETYLKTIADRLLQGPLAELKLIITWSVVLSDDVAGAIIQEAEHGERAEHVGHGKLIVMAAHGRSGLQRLVRGSVTEHVLGATRLPLLLVRPQEAAIQL
jgi:nucleotide-binding universal stress UspA family protein